MKINKVKAGAVLPPRIQYDFHTLEVGEALVFTEVDALQIKRIRRAASQYATRKGIKLATRLREGELNVYRTQ